jgi:methionyl aminopeptidase
MKNYALGHCEVRSNLFTYLDRHAIAREDQAYKTIFMWKSKKIFLKTPEQIAKIREWGKYLEELLRDLYTRAVAWVRLQSLEDYAEKFLRMHNLKGAFKWYEWYPANLCLSVNAGLVHCLPDEYLLKDGDLLKIDCWVVYQGLISDAAVAKVIGWKNKNPAAQLLLQLTKEWLDSMVQTIKPGLWLYAFGNNMENFFKKRGHSVIKSLTGHGVGLHVHEAPSIFNCGHPSNKGEFFKSGMVVAIEPITALRSIDYVEDHHNGRNLYSKWWDLGCQWEYTIAVTDTGMEILAWVQENLREHE